MPLLLLAWCVGLVAGNQWMGPPAAGWLVLAGVAAGALGVALTWGRRRRARRWAVLVAALLIAVARGAATVHVPGPATMEGRLGQRVVLVGTVVRAGGGGGVQSFWLAQIHVAGKAVDGTVQVGARGAVTVVPGSTVRAEGVLQRLPGRAHDGTTGYDYRMERAGVLAAMPGASYVVLSPPSQLSLAAMAWRARATLAAAMRARVPEPEASILLGVLVGIRASLPPAIEGQLVDSGLVHLLAVSGLKVALLASVLAVLLRQASRRAALLAILGIFGYALVGGGSAAAVRAAVMGSLALLAQVLRRDPDPPRSLLLAAAPMLTLNPALAGDLSFEYSFLGVAGIQLMQPAIAAGLGFLPRLLRDGLSVSLAAQVATIPLTAAYFHVITLASPLTNALAIPLLGPTMAAAAWVGLALPDPAGVIAAAAAGAAHGVLALAAVGSGPAGLVLTVPWFGGAEATGYLAGLAVLLGAAHMRRPRARLPRLFHGALGRPATAATVAAAVLLALSRPDGHLHLAFLETPGGGALVTAPDGARLLVDSGSSAARLAVALDARLAPESPRLETLLLTGSAPAAAGGVEGLGHRRPDVYLGPAQTPGDIPQRLAAALGAGGTRVEWLAPGDRLAWHGVDLRVDGCGAGLALTLRYGASVAWICDVGVPGDAGVLPPGPLAVIDTGPGGVSPEGAATAAGWVVARGRGNLSGTAAGLGPRLWRPPRDGPLDLRCDLRGCDRS